MSFDYLFNSTQIITKIQKNFYEEVTQLLSDFKENSTDADISNGYVFGTNIPYNQARVVWPDTDKLHNMSPEGTNSSTDKFTMMIHETKPSVQKKSVVSIHWMCVNGKLILITQVFFSIVV